MDSSGLLNSLSMLQQSRARNAQMQYEENVRQENLRAKRIQTIGMLAGAAVGGFGFAGAGAAGAVAPGEIGAASAGAGGAAAGASAAPAFSGGGAMMGMGMGSMAGNMLAPSSSSDPMQGAQMAMGGYQQSQQNQMNHKFLDALSTLFQKKQQPTPWMPGAQAMAQEYEGGS